MSVSQAKNKLNDLGLVLEAVSYVVSKEPENTVLSMRPAAEEVVALGTKVDVTAAKSADVSRTTQYVEFIVPPGGDNQDVRIVVADAGGSRVVYTNSHKGGVRLRQQIEGTGSIKVKFYCNDKLVEEKSL